MALHLRFGLNKFTFKEIHSNSTINFNSTYMWIRNGILSLTKWFWILQNVVPLLEFKKWANNIKNVIFQSIKKFVNENMNLQTWSVNNEILVLLCRSPHTGFVMENSLPFSDCITFNFPTRCGTIKKQRTRANNLIIFIVHSLHTNVHCTLHF